MRNIGNTRILFVDCPKEMVDRTPPSLHGNSLDVIRITPDSSKCCLTHGSTLNFVNYINTRIMDDDHDDLVVYLVNFRNTTAIKNFRAMVDSLYPMNLIEFIENPYLIDIYDLVSSYLYTLDENPEVYGYKSFDIYKMHNDWMYFTQIDYNYNE